MKRKIEPINYGVTRTDMSYQVVMMDLMKRLIE